MMKNISDHTHVELLFQRIDIHIDEIDFYIVNPVTQKAERPLLFLVEDCFTRTLLSSMCSYQKFSVLDLVQIIETYNLIGEIGLDLDDLPFCSFRVTEIKTT